MSKIDALPKWICTDCWQKTEQFHRFHRSVQQAQENYFNEIIKCEFVDPLNILDTEPVNQYELEANIADIITEPKKADQSDYELEQDVKQNDHTEFEENIEIDDDILTNIKQDEDEDEDGDEEEDDEDKISETDLTGKKFKTACLTIYHLTLQYLYLFLKVLDQKYQKFTLHRNKDRNFWNNSIQHVIFVRLN